MKVHCSLKQAAEDKDDPSVSKRTEFYVDPRTLVLEPGFNVRLETKKLQEVIQEYKRAYQKGALFPAIDVEVVNGERRVRDGHLRTRAALLAIAEGTPIRRIPAREWRGTAAESTLHMLGSAEKAQLSTLEKGIGYNRLLKFGWTKAEIAEARNVSLAHIDQALMLANADADLQELVAEEMVTVNVAIDALREHGKNAGSVLREIIAAAPTEVTEDGEERRKKITKREANASRAPAKRRVLPRSLADRYVSNVSALFSSMPEDVLAQVVASTDDATIPVSARYLRELLAAQNEAQEVYQPAGEKEKESDPRQTSLLVDEC
ncbi:hypothetical protein [Burkholderia multivorans]|uniref:hypothetical protein n=1 Tax=Burkholderia multivorans TaxID=87883 RepID=UPI00057FD5C0|nr:hypothetical protein [Burkholderia multivorans]KHS09451.1 hypothetical protein BMD20_29750 [Burkholderia multivorans]KHS10352.1 hypothetical protein BMD22_28075 [Burkholderia multivorans]MDR9230003.1 hypothetical protein [Burkholderia multivorans]HDR9474366.1 hypothetical protein [Burkholderia multivorans]HDR9480208.1 hypothetical protein [Burkholderia multivorans]